MDRIVCKPFSVLIRAKFDDYSSMNQTQNYGDENKIKFYLSKVIPLTPKEEGKLLV